MSTQFKTRRTIFIYLSYRGTKVVHIYIYIYTCVCVCVCVCVKTHTHKHTGERYVQENSINKASTKKQNMSICVCRSYSPVAGGALLQLVRLAPVGNALVFVLDNDIYYRPSSSFGAEEKRVTFNGVPGIFYNGVPDWVYEGNSRLKPGGYCMYTSLSNQEISSVYTVYDFFLWISE